jgi:hypothetical protein
MFICRPYGRAFVANPEKGCPAMFMIALRTYSLSFFYDSVYGVLTGVLAVPYFLEFCGV